MSDVRAIQPFQRPVDAEVELVGSKSYTNRALIIAALARGESLLTGALFSDDTRYMGEALRQLGVGVEADENARTLRVQGVAGQVRATVLIDETGIVNEVRAIEAAASALESAARDLLLHTRFTPARKDGRIVKAQVRVSLDYGPR